MKYSVQIKYTNPSHEHVSLRRRVESVTRLVEAANEQEALNRAANQQRALGFMIKEANVIKPKEEIDEKWFSSGSFETSKHPNPIKYVTATDHGTTDTLEGPVKHAPGHKIVTGPKGEKYPISPEKFKELYDDNKDGTATPKRIPKIAKLADHDGVVKASWGNLNYSKGKHVIVRHGPGDYGVVEKDIFHQTYDASKLNEEVEQIDEMDKSQPSSSRGAEGLPLGKKAKPAKTDEVKSNALKALQKQYKKVKEEVQYIEEKLTASDPASKWIADFVKSDNPRFVGKSKKERINQALGAYYAAKRGKVEEGFNPSPAEIAKMLVKQHGAGNVTKQHILNLESDRDSFKGLDHDEVMKHVQKMSEEVEQIDELDVRGSPLTRAKMVANIGKNVIGAGINVARKKPEEARQNLKTAADLYAASSRMRRETDPNKSRQYKSAAASLRRDLGEEVEKIDEVKTANPGRGYHGEHPADKADAKYAEMHAKLLKTAVAGNSSSKKIRNYLDSTHGRHLAGHENDSEYIAKDFAKFDRSYKPEMFKEEQIDELKKSTLASYVKGATRDVASASRLQRGYETDAARSEFAPVRRGSELAAKNMRKFAGKRSRGIARAVDKLTKEEVVTEAEREAGYKMPAHVAAGQKKFDAQAKGQNKPRPQAGTLAAKKIKEAAEKMVKKVRAMKDDKKFTKTAEIKLDNEKKKVNKINMEPSVEVKG